MKRHSAPPRALAALLLLGAALITPVPTAHAAAFTVTTANDGADANLGDGHCDADSTTAGDQCSLRAAIMEANALGGTTTHTITLSALVGSTYTLTQPGTSDDGGDLDIRTRITINGAAPSKAIVRVGASTATAIDRVFEVQSGGRLTLNDLTVSYGRARSGGAIGVQPGGQLVLTDVVAFGGQAYTTGGGGIETNGDATLTGVTLSSNSAATDGGGLLVGSSATVSLTNVTVSGNQAATGGGIATSGTLTLRNVTIAGNTATDRGGGLRDISSPTLRVGTTILADNTGGDCSGTSNADSMGYNLVKGNSCGFAQTGDRQSTDPLLGPLGEYGGPTPTRPLTYGSPAIDAGSGPVCVATDQRGIPRPEDGDGDGGATCDVGAFERLRFVVSTNEDGADSNVGDSICHRSLGGCTLRAAVQEAGIFGGTTIALALGSYGLTIEGRDEDGGATGDLDVRNDITIVGGDEVPLGTVIAAGFRDRIFDVPFDAHPTAALTLRNLRLYNGDPGDADGGGIAVRASRPLTLDGVHVSTNRARSGAGILANGTTLIERSMLSYNVATDEGGGLYNDDTATTTVRQSTIDHNQARNGGGIFARCSSACGDLTVVTSTISDNSASTSGGGVYNESQATFRGVTLASNTAGQAAGGVRVVVQGTARETTFSNTIVAFNTPTGCSFTGGTPALLGPNLDTGTSCGFNRSDIDLSGADPRLGPLADNGGWTHTRLPMGSSPAIDAGNDAECALAGDDQTLKTRRRDGDGDGSTVCDIGAVEVQHPYPADLAVHTVGPSTIEVGAALNYGVFVSNGAEGAAANTVVTMDLPGSATFVGVSTPIGSCTRSGAIVACNLGTLQRLVGTTLILTVTPTQEGALTLGAAATTTSPDSDSNNNRATAITTVLRPATPPPPPANAAPTATADSYTVLAATPATVPAPGVLANDADLDPGTTLHAQLVSGPGHGSLTLGPDGGFVYRPNADFAGTDRFTYRASDGTATSGPATVTITVAAQRCAPRPRAQSTPAAGGGRLQVTIQATPLGTGEANPFTEIAFGTFQNARVTLDGQSVASGQVLALPAGTTTVTLSVQRLRVGQATTVPFTLKDGCGTWPSFVGGGPEAGF